MYSDNFKRSDTASEWVNLVGIILLSFLLLSQVILPPQNRSNYLGICLTGSALGMSVGFVLPLGTKPDQCFDAITPNDMYSSTSCALTGAMIATGSLSVLTWILVRVISMHLQVCWGIIPGVRFFWISQVFAWGVPLIFANATLFVSGVSFRFGSACYLNHFDSMIFWGPLICIGGTAVLCQTATFAYCARVYLSNTCGGRRDHHRVSIESLRSEYIPNVYRKISEVLRLQWRSMCLVSVVLMELALFCLLFIFLDHAQQAIIDLPDKVGPWVVCLMVHEKDECRYLTKDFMIRENIVNAAIILYSLTGIVIFALLIQPSIFSAWWKTLRGASRQEPPIVCEELTTSSRSSRPHTGYISDFDYKSPLASPLPTHDHMAALRLARSKASMSSGSERTPSVSSSEFVQLSSPPPTWTRSAFEWHTPLPSPVNASRRFSWDIRRNVAASASKTVEVLGRLL